MSRLWSIWALAKLPRKPEDSIIYGQCGDSPTPFFAHVLWKPRHFDVTYMTGRSFQAVNAAVPRR